MVQALGTVSQPLAQAVFNGQAQAEVKSVAQGTQEQDLPVAELIAARLNYQCPVGRHAAAALKLAAYMEA